MTPFRWLPVVERPLLFTTLEDACYCGALFSVFGVFDFTIGPMSTLSEFCYEEESNWQAMTRYFGNFVRIISLVLFITCIFYVFGVKKKKRGPILLYMIVVSINNTALLVYSVLLLTINIINNDTECDYPNIKCKDVIVRTTIKIILSLFFVTIYSYILIVAKGYTLTFEPPAPKSKSKSKDVENPPLRITDASTSDAKK